LACGGITVRAQWPWAVLLLLLAACLAHGLWVVRGLGPYTAVYDAYRDVGFVQGFLDGNLLGDPSTEGAQRYYPPLLHALAALVAFITQIPPLELLIRAAPWVNLLVPASFFLMVRRLVNAPAAAIATTLFVCFDGLLLPPWMAASYTPWTSVPALTQALFFCSVWLISARIQQARFIDALSIGSAIGIVFLAHTVPALILATITAAAALATHRMTMRTVAWIVAVGGVVVLWALPFLLPLVISYHLKIVHANGAFIDTLFDPGLFPKRVLAAIAPGLLALAWVGWSFWRRRDMGVALSRATLATLAVWFVLPALFIARHYGCGGGGTSTVCTAFVVPVHHWMFYLQSALACVFGYAVMSATSRAEGNARSTAAAGAVFAVACALLIFRPIDWQMRDRALDMRNRFDVQLYQWSLSHTPPSTLFVADVSTNGVHDTASAAVLAAGRRTVALPFTYSSPYVNWEARRDRAESYLAAARSGTGKQTLCRALSEAGPGNALYIALATEVQRRESREAPAARRGATGVNGAADNGQLHPVLQTELNALYSVQPSVCN
jgi:hypothetical protein